MVGRYLAVHWPSAMPDGGTARRSVRNAERLLGLTDIHQRPGFALMVEAGVDVLKAASGRTTVIGTLFPQHGESNGIVEVDQETSHAIESSRGDRLITGYWGSYVAFVTEKDSGALHVIRDPSGSVSAYTATNGEVTYFASDPEMLVSLGIADGKLDWPSLAHHICYPLLRNGRTCLLGVDAVLPGMALTLQPDGSRSERYPWNPWDYARGDQQIENMDEAIEAVSFETRRCALALASQSNHILLELSGGLDSSIVAACLRKTTAELSLVTLMSAEPGSDERRYARIVAESIGAPLHEIMLQTTPGDILRLPKARSAFPDQSLLHQIMNDALSQHAAAINADSFFSGGGGDNVFCYLGTASPAADVLRKSGFSRNFYTAVSELADLYRSTIWTAARYAVRKALWAKPIFARREIALLAQEAIPSAPLLHHWFNRPPGSLPGKLEHLISIAYGQWATDSSQRAQFAALRYPLLAQPLVQTCLRIPTWMWIAQGRNRSIARDAFKDDLPREILQRRSKGDFVGFVGEMYKQNASIIREVLLDGHLARAGLLDRDAVEKSLAAPTQPGGTAFNRLLTLARPGIWAESWIQGRSPMPAT